MSLESRHVSVFIAAGPDAVYDYAADPARLPEWAAGLAGGIRQEADGRWIADAPFGTVEVRFAPRNDLGVLDHEVVAPDGRVFFNPLRVVAAGDGAEVIFTVRRQDAMTDEQFEADTAAVTADLDALRRRLEAAQAQDQL